MIFKKNKKAQHAPDMVDFILTVFFSFFLLMFIGMILNGGIDKFNDQTEKNVDDFKRLNLAIHNLRMQSAADIEINIADIETQIEKSKIVDGKIVTSCNDYTNENQCNKDVVELYHKNKNRNCQWVETENLCQVNTNENG
tara:strand:- start:619 stop:1038 length:420 start_codon:yes stop_codon:yes gene_type:complete